MRITYNVFDRLRYALYYLPAGCSSRLFPRFTGDIPGGRASQYKAGMGRRMPEERRANDGKHQSEKAPRLSLCGSGSHGGGGVVSSGGILQYVSYYVLETVPAYTFDHIAFDIDPAAGNTPDMTATVTDGDPGSKLASAVAWTDLGTTGTGTTGMTASSKFQGGHYYECRVTFTLSETTNYQFPGVGGMTITANGTEIPETADPNATQTSCFKRVSEGTTVKYIVYLRSELPEEGKLGLSSITREGGTIKYTILHNDTVPSTTVYVFAAQYKDGQLVDVKQSAKITVNGSDENGEFTGFTHAEGCTYKLFLLENGKYVPLCNAADIP